MPFSVRDHAPVGERRSRSIASAARAALVIGILGASGLALGVAPAAANNLFTLDSQATSPGRVVEDAAGTAYLTWTHKSPNPSLPDPPMFCKIAVGGTCSAPISLPIPKAESSTDEVAGVFPVLGPGNTVYVVAPRYVKDDVIIWTSTNGGASFGAGTAYEGGYSNKSDPTDVLLSGGNLLIGANNSGLGFSTTPAAGGEGANFSFINPGSGGVAGSSMGLDSSGNPVEAYWNISSPQYGVFYYRYKGSGPIAEEKDWEGPTQVSSGYEDKLAGGAAGLFLVSEDYGGASQYPYLVNVRRYNGTSFGAPVTLSSDTNAGLFDGGAIAQSPGGRLAVAWPETRSADRAAVLRLFTSTNGGASFDAGTDVARLTDGYSIGDNAQLALGEGGQGWLTYNDAGGLRVADLNPIAGPSTPKVTPTKPATYTGKTKTITSAVGGELLTLRVPQSCLQSQQPFYVGVGKRARHKVAKSLRAKLKVVKVTFFFDGKKLKTLKKKPFRYLIDPGPLAAGTKHVVKARVSALIHRHGKKKKVVRTLKGQISIC